MIAVSEFTRARSSSSSTCPRSGCASSRTPSTRRFHARRRRAPRATTCSPSGRSSRARTCRGSPRRRAAPASSCASSARAAGAAWTPRDGVRWLGFVAGRGARAPPTAARAASSTPRSTRASASRSSRRWRRHARRHDRGGATEEIAGRRRGARRPARRRGDRGRDRGGGARATSCAPSASSGRGVHLGGRGRGDRRRLPRGRRVKLVVLDADVLGRRRTGDETYVREPPARAARRAATPACVSPR